MAYTEITNYNSRNFTPAASVPAVFGRPRVVEAITIHWWGTPDVKRDFYGIVNFLCGVGNAGTSAHAVIDTGRCAWIVNGYDAAWHSGNAVGNATTIGLELDPYYPHRAGTEQTAAEVIADLWRAYGRILPLKPHNHWQNTQCPGDIDIDGIYRKALAIYKGKPAPAPKPAAKPAPKPVVRPASTGARKSGFKWKVTEGDAKNTRNLNYICKRYGKTRAEVDAVNPWTRGIGGGTELRVGRVVEIPAPLEWHVVASDPQHTRNLNYISNYYGASRELINKLNPWAVSIGGNTELRVGRVVVIAK